MCAKYKGITVPYEYFDKKRNYVFYAYKDKDYHDVAKVFKAFVGSYLTYHFEVKDKEIEVNNLSDVLDNLIRFSDTFKIPSKYKDEYSELEYEYIKGLLDAIKKDKLSINYNPEFRYSKKDFKTAKIYRFSKEIDKKYNDVVLPKRIKDKIFNNDYYVVGGVAYQSIYYALEVVYEGGLFYQFGGTKNPNNRTHQIAHNFDDLIGLILKKSSKFVIHEHQYDFYSKQELEFLNLLSNKLNEMGYKSVEPKYEEEYTEEYNYLKDNRRYLGILLNNIKYYLKRKRTKKAQIKSHKI